MAKDKTYRRNLEIVPVQKAYEVKLNKPNWRWLWLLLLLLPLFLLIRCERTIEVHTEDLYTGEAVADAEVTISYTSYYLYKDGEFFVAEHHTETVTTDENGDAEFEGIGYSVYSYIFCPAAKATFTATTECKAEDPSPSECRYQFTSQHTITMGMRTDDIALVVLDEETFDPLPDATILYEYELKNKVLRDSARSDGSGHFYLKGVPVCGEVTLKKVERYGYRSRQDVNLSMPEVLQKKYNGLDEEVLMTPERRDVVFRTIDGDTGKVLPDCDLIITTTRSHVTEPINSGPGEFTVKGLYVMELISITASKDGYATNNYTIEDEVVDDLIQAPQEFRDIPLDLYVAPCNQSTVPRTQKPGEVSEPFTFNMGVSQGTFNLEYETYSCADQIDVYNHTADEPYNKRPPIYSTGMVMTFEPESVPVPFKYGDLITIVVTAGEACSTDTNWVFTVNCP